jgi:hypothetical protein
MNFNLFNIGEITLKDILKYLKESPTFILLFITTLGGVWQLIQLSKISITYIRFFSISQVIPDGLILTLGFLVYVVVVVWATLASYSLLSDIINSIKDDSKKKFKKKLQSLNFEHPIFGFTYAIFTIALGIWFIYGSFIFKTSNVFVFMISNLAVMILLYAILDRYQRIVDYMMAKNDIKILMGIIICGIIINFFSIVIAFNQNYLMPENLKNFEVIKSNFKNENPKASIQILYFNDKYLFTKITDVSNSKGKKQQIEIIDFESIPTK